MKSRATLAFFALWMASAQAGGPADGRQLVTLPDEMRNHVLANMREHLESLEQVNGALSRGDYDTAASVAEKKLGLSSMEAHGASHLARFLPEGMQRIGSQMHRSASRLAVAAQDAAAAQDARPALAALSDVMRQCVACHAAYRFH